jgi:hypothetical protein
MKRVSIVLANLMAANGILNHETAARVDHAIWLEGDNPSDLLLLCGWPYRVDCGVAIADAMRIFIAERHPKYLGKVRCQRLSRDTVGDAVLSRIYLDSIMDGSLREVHVVTSDYHVERTRVIFDFVFRGFSDVFVSGVSGFSSDKLVVSEMESLEAFERTFEGALPGDMPSIFGSLCSKHPYYNGEVYPKLQCFQGIRHELLVEGGLS